MLVRVLVPALLFVLAVGAPAPASDIKIGHDDMEKIGIAYKSYCDDKGEPPAQVEQLAPYLDNNKRLVDALKDKDIVFYYDVPQKRIGSSTGQSLTVLAYEKDAPTKGGWVVVFDGGASHLSADEFKKLKLPKK
jgi:hypothetical protein